MTTYSCTCESNWTDINLQDVIIKNTHVNEISTRLQSITTYINSYMNGHYNLPLVNKNNGQLIDENDITTLRNNYHTLKAHEVSFEFCSCDFVCACDVYCTCYGDTGCSTDCGVDSAGCSTDCGCDNHCPLNCGSDVGCPSDCSCVSDCGGYCSSDCGCHDYCACNGECSCVAY